MTTPDQNSLPTDSSMSHAPDTRRSRIATLRRMAEQQVAELKAQLELAPNDIRLKSKLQEAEAVLRNVEEHGLEELGVAVDEVRHRMEVPAQTARQGMEIGRVELDLTRIQVSRLWEEVLQIPRDMDDLQDSVIYWQSLVGHGREFEIAVGKLFANLGFDVVVTKESGDEGVDVRVEGDGETMVVQCKAQKARVSTGILREIARARTAQRAHRAACVSTTGFADRAQRFAARADIYLFSPTELAELGSSAKQDMDFLRGNLVIETDDAPSCPDCGRLMRKQLPHHRIEPFWGCSNYPRCEGTRPV